ncbi:beta-lactamase family protein [Halomonas sp. ML-15]|uniref:serine hydrolase domain-containing protein n=1 Tax=Halomonas sp. ML-15 TaxID=2773305 RepID=UPI001745CD99|nr:serine hydrolase domain-containing protein [Halomonas sp. ML-15]MBD3894489.1 beta-lactamase family protein [Halomonas sp. ML-15]
MGTTSSRVAIATLMAAALPVSGAVASDTSSGSVRNLYDGRLMPDEQVNAYRNIDALFPTRVVPASSSPHKFGERSVTLDDFTFTDDDTTYDLYDFMSLNRVSGLIVVHDNDIVLEQYALGNDRDTPWMSMSVVKSIASTLIGAAIQDGHIGSLDDNVVQYVPELEGSAYDGVSVEHILLMASGVAWDETYDDPDSDRREMLERQISQEQGSIIEQMATLERVGDPGEVWNYSTGETQLLAAIIEGAVGTSVSDYLSETLWASYGMEHDAEWWLDAEDGQEIGGSGLLATLRDYARFGQFILDERHNDNGQGVLPDGWVDTAGRTHEVGGETVPYGYSWWPVGDEGAFAAVGIFGQWVFVHPDKNMVIAMTGAQPKSLGFEIVPVSRFFHALTDVITE